MNKPLYFSIQIKGLLPREWASWFNGLEIKDLPDGCALVSGTLADQAALMGVLYQVANLGLEIKLLVCSQSAGDLAKGDLNGALEISKFTKTTP